MDKSSHVTFSLLGVESAINVVNKQETSLSPSIINETKMRDAERGCVVRRVTVSEYKQAAQCLAEAFAKDEVARYFTHMPDTEHWTDAQKWKLHVEILEYITYAHILKGLVLTVGPAYGCVALWMPPGKNIDDYMTALRSGLWRLRYKMSAEGRVRIYEEFFPLLHTTKEKFDPEDKSYYLVYIGTKDSARGKGYARKLIEYVTKLADAEGKACYLESSNAINPIIYRKLGFEVVGKIELNRAKNKLELDIMIREPVPAGAPFAPVLQKVDSAFGDEVPKVSVAGVGNTQAQIVLT